MIAMRQEAATLASMANWRKSSYSHSQNGCVEIGAVQGIWGIRDSKLGAASPILSVRDKDFRSFIRAVKSGALDI
jgi:Domain of unknown function (DUF397)